MRTSTSLLVACRPQTAWVSTTERYRSIFLFARSGDSGNPMSNVIYFLLSCKELLSELLFFVHGTLPITSVLCNAISAPRPTQCWGTMTASVLSSKAVVCESQFHLGLDLKSPVPNVSLNGRSMIQPHW